jgi:acyl carrier protein
LSDAEKTIRSVIDMLLERRGATGLDVAPESRLSEDLGLDSLELAELSATLEEDLGSDPYSEGLVPATVAELVGFYAAA